MLLLPAAGSGSVRPGEKDNFFAVAFLRRVVVVVVVVIVVTAMKAEKCSTVYETHSMSPVAGSGAR
jgi:hypothetical protein